MKRAVLDTNILISALGWDGNEDRVVRMALSGKLEIVTSPQLMGEFKRAALQPGLDFTEAEVDEFFDALLEVCSLVNPPPTLKVARDTADNKILECALEGHAEFVISGDKDLLELGEFRGVKILNAGDFLRL